MSSLSGVDIFIVVASLLFVFGVAIWGAFKSRKQKTNQAEEYFLAGRSMPWMIVAASLFASNIGAEHFVGQAGASAINGMAIGLYEWLAAYMILIAGWIFAPVFLSAKLYTIPEYLERRYNSSCRLLYVVLTMVAYIVTKIGATLYAGGVILDVLLGLNIWESTPLIIIATASYTVAGGLTAVMLTDTIQTFIFLFGGLFGLAYSLDLVGGLFSMFDELSDDRIGLERLRHTIRPVSDRDVPSLGMLIGIPVVSIWYWCVDQEMAQRILSAKSLPHARMGAAAAALCKAVPVFITVVPGIVARTLYELCIHDSEGQMFPEWCARDLENDKEADKAYPLMVLHEFPNGVRGIMVASFLAAMMSSLSSVYNSASTIFTYDVYERFYGKGTSSPERLVFVGRLVTVVLTSLTVLWLPVVQASSRGLYVVGQQAGTHVVPAISAVFVAGLFIPFSNGPGALSGMISGVLFGILRVIPYFLYQDYCDDRVDEISRKQNMNWINWTVCLNFNYFAIILFSFTIAVICTVSRFTEPPRDSQIQGLVSQLVRPMYHSSEAMNLQMTNIQYESVQETGSGDFQNEVNSEAPQIAKENGEKSSLKVRIMEESWVTRVRKLFSVDDGYSAHFLSIVTVVCITVLIIVFH
eukprot:g5238.t1